MNRKVIIVGGGIGGLATARGLLHMGWEVTLYEQARSFGPVGAGITLAPNAVRALDWLGLGAELRSRGMAHGAAGIRDASGRWLMRTRVEALEARFGVPSFALHRADLHEMLLAGAVASLIPASAFLRMSDETLGWRPPPARLTLQAEATAIR
jgi:2-polyprenyl-6-methoxyphenol hydroxylase-like FAD-dependent oxidoreductase